MKVQVPVPGAEKDPAFYVVPPLLVAAVFAFCAYVPRELLDFKRPSAGSALVQAERPKVELPDPNLSLPEFKLPAGCSNLLQNARAVTVSAEVEGAPALHAVNGSCADDDKVAVAAPGKDKQPAWWQVKLPQGAAAQQLVIYGGGSKSPAGKLVGGFRVEVEYDNSRTQNREFCREGFALEGYETMKLDSGAGVKSIRVTALRPDTPLVLREVQLISAAE